MKKLLVKFNEEIITQTIGEDVELEAWLEADKHKYPEGYTVEYVDITAEVEAQKAKEDKKKNFSFKGNTIANLRNELNEWLEMGK